MRRLMLENMKGGEDMAEWKEIGRTTLSVAQKSIMIDCDTNQYSEILMYCGTCSADGKTTSHLDAVFGNLFRISNSLHATQNRIHYFHAKKIFNNDWFCHIGYGYANKGISNLTQSVEFEINGTRKSGAIANVKRIGFEAFKYGEANLKEGSTLVVYAR